MIACGTEIARCQPFCHVASADIRNSVCDFCLSQDSSTSSFKKCSGCKFVYYCSVKCQKSAWQTYHKKECLYLRKVMPKYPTDTVRLLARIVLKLREGGMRESADLPDGQKRYFDDLMTHQREIVRDPERIEAFQAFYEILRQCLDFCPPKNEILEIYCRVLINSFNIMNEEYQTIGIGLYLTASVLDHSCDPNATVVFQGKKLILRTIKNVESYESLRISYTNLLDTKEVRRRNLAKQYYFSCACAKCETGGEEDKSVMLCQGQSCHGDVPIRTGCCQICQRLASDQELQHYDRVKNQFESMVLKNSSGHPEPEEQCEAFYGDMKEIFHPFDKTYLDLLELLYEQRVSQENFEGAFEICRLILKHYQRHYPKYDVNTALMAMKAAKLGAFLNCLNEAEMYLNVAKDILRVTHGQSHSLYAVTLKKIMQDIEMGKRELKDIALMTKKTNGAKNLIVKSG